MRTYKYQQPIADFWELFRQLASELATIDTPDHPVYDRLLAQLHKISPGLYFEFSFGRGNHELIITADGDSSLFPLVHAIVSNAPHTPGWRVRALKPKSGFPVTTQWEGLTITIADVLFEPLERKGSKHLGLRIFVPGLRAKDEEKARNAILRALDQGLGERGFAESVRHTEVRSLPDGASTDDYIPLAKLDHYYIQWRKKKLKKGAR